MVMIPKAEAEEALVAANAASAAAKEQLTAANAALEEAREKLVTAEADLKRVEGELTAATARIEELTDEYGESAPGLQRKIAILQGKLDEKPSVPNDYLELQKKASRVNQLEAEIKKSTGATASMATAFEEKARAKSELEQKKEELEVAKKYLNPEKYKSIEALFYGREDIKKSTQKELKKAKE
jgi:chromosome segregation ATPase